MRLFLLTHCLLLLSICIGGLCFVLVLWYSSLYHFKFCNHLTMEEIAGRLTLTILRNNNGAVFCLLVLLYIHSMTFIIVKMYAYLYIDIIHNCRIKP